MVERRSRKAKVTSSILVAASSFIDDTLSDFYLPLYLPFSHPKKNFEKKVVPLRIELRSQEPKSYMLPLHHGTFLIKRWDGVA